MKTLEEWVAFTWEMIKDKSVPVNLPTAIKAIANMDSFKKTGLSSDEIYNKVKVLIETEREIIKDRIKVKLKVSKTQSNI